MFIFDTDHLGVIQLQRGPEFHTLQRRIQQYDETDFFVTIVSFQEQILGWNAYIARAKNEDSAVRGYTKLAGILSDFARAQVLPYTPAAAEIFTDLRRLRIRIATTDCNLSWNDGPDT